MATFSLCMIVKDESAVLKRCLDSVADLMDEIIIVDTGSTDDTKAIAAEYTDRIFDFKWIGDFSAARNFAFSKATCDYIYSADADEVLEEDARRQFRLLKEVIDPAIEMVQMKYHEPMGSTVLNSKMEYRPKLFKRLRTFTWIDPVHEHMRLDPVVFDSDIVITHLPQAMHHDRDFAIFEKSFESGYYSKDLLNMYVRELYKCGSPEDLENGYRIISDVFETAPAVDQDQINDVLCLFFRYFRITGNDARMMAQFSGMPESEKSGEYYYELGEYFLSKGMYDDARINFDRAVFTESRIDIRTSGELAYKGAIKAIESLISDNESGKPAGFLEEQLEEHRKALMDWELPEEQ